MCSIRVFGCLAAFLAAASASDLKIKIIDPQSAAVAGSQVSLFPENSSIPFGVQTSSGEGHVLFPGVPDGKYQVRVLAPGFAPEKQVLSIPRDSTLTVQLRVATPTATVVVSATRLPAPEQESGDAESEQDGAEDQIPGERDALRQGKLRHFIRSPCCRARRLR